MTIMLLPKGQMLVLGGEGMTLDTMEHISKYMERWLRGVDKVMAINSITQIIDARVEPAIAINVPK